MKDKNSLVLVLAFVILAGVMFYGITVYSSVKKEELKNQKALACGQLYRYTETLANGATTSYPMEKEYNACLDSQ